MKKIAFLAAVAATLCTVACMVSCNKNDVPETPVPDQEIPAQNAEDEDLCELTVRVNMGEVKTKMVGDLPSNLTSSIYDIQVLVFRPDGYLDAFGATHSNWENGELELEKTVKCSKGEREVYVLLNCPDLSAVGTKTEFLASSATLYDEYAKYHQFIGSDEVSLPAESAVNIEVHRIAARVVIDKITRAFTVSAYANATFTVKKIYLTNVVGSINYGGDTPGTWYNKRSHTGGVNGIMDNLNAAILNNESYETRHFFQAFPNPTEEDSTSSTWCPRHTRLVVEAQLGNDTFYYPITLPVLESNKSYEITELILTRIGSTDPDQPVSIQDCSFEFTIKDWSTVEVTDGTTI